MGAKANMLQVGKFIRMLDLFIMDTIINISYQKLNVVISYWKETVLNTVT
jgi:hypothetical protein